jgi:hypothetical protein
MLHEQAELTGTVHQGVIVVDGGVELREGQSVKIILEESAQRPTAASPLGEFLLQFAGIADDLPPDLPENHDHYLYGTPKRSE